MTKPHQPQLGAYIKRQREARGLSIRALAKVSGVDGSNLSRIERGERSAMPDILQAIARGLAIPLVELMATGKLRARDLPSLDDYLRVRYRQLPEDQIRDVELYIQRLIEAHGDRRMEAVEDEIEELFDS